MSMDKNLTEAVLAQVCWVTGCRNRRKLKNSNGVMEMFSFPRNTDLADFWLAICNRIPYSCPFHGQLVCIDHFDKDDIRKTVENGTSVTYLLPDTVPKLNVPNIVQPILEEYWIQKKLGASPILRSVKVDYNHKKFAFRGETCPGVDPDLVDDGDESETKCNKAQQCLKRQSNKKQPGTSTSTESTSSSTQCLLGKKRKSTETKVIVLPRDIQNRVTQVMRSMADIMQNFMAYQIYIIHLQQKLVDAEENIRNLMLENDFVPEENLYRALEEYHNAMLKTLTLQSEGCSDALSAAAKVWKRSTDCHRQIKNQGKLQTFITCANGCLVTIVKVIDAVNVLKKSWKRFFIQNIQLSHPADNQVLSEFRLECMHLLNEVREKLTALDLEVHATRQKIIDIKKPAIRIMEVEQLVIEPENISIVESLNSERTHGAKSFPSAKVAPHKRFKRSTITQSNTDDEQPSTSRETTATPDASESTGPPQVTSTTNLSNNTPTSSASLTVSSSTTSESVTTPSLVRTPQTSSQSLVISQVESLATTSTSDSPTAMPTFTAPITTPLPSPAAQFIQQPLFQSDQQSLTGIPAMQQLSMQHPAMQHPAMQQPAALPQFGLGGLGSLSGFGGIQPQLIPTIQMDAFGNQSIVYQLVQPSVSYQQVNVNGVPTIVPVAVTPGTNPMAINAAPNATVASNEVVQTICNDTKVKAENDQSCEEELKIKQEPSDE